MTIEQEYFSKMRPNVKALLDYGFEHQQQSYYYCQTFFHHQFQMRLTVTPPNTVIGMVIDCATNEEYLPLSAVHCGPFAAKVKTAYLQILRDISDHCFIAEPFYSPQANRLAIAINNQFSETPEFIFKQAPDYAIFREPQSQKWYGLVMRIPRSRLTKKAGDDTKIEIIDVRVNSEQQPQLLKIPGIYHGYHLNKKSWLSILLDDSLSDEQIMELIIASRYSLIQPSSWLIPANPKYYDVMHAFDKQDEIIWKQGANIHVNDIVFLYVTSPIKAIMYRCQVTANNIPYHYDTKELKITKAMRIRLIKKYAPSQYDFSFLKSHGIKTIRGPRHLPTKVQQKIK